VSRKTGAEPLTASGEPIGLTLVDFWRWRLSDVLDNLDRGALAEFIVATALGIPTDGDGDPGAVWDLTMTTSTTCIRLEVKSAAYLQSWGQKELSQIVFSTPKTRAWDRVTNTFDAVAKRHAHVYVFALLNHTDKATVDPLELDQWRFDVISTAVLHQRDKDRVTLESLGGELRFGELRQAVLEAASEPGCPLPLDESSAADC
jgi:hypothetical protein